MYRRAGKSLLEKRLTRGPRRFVQVIYGHGQVGKTRMVRQIRKDLAYPFHFVAADALTAGDVVWIAQQWERARMLHHSKKNLFY